MSLIVFDFDGTLVDPLPAVVHCVGRTCGDLDMPCPPVEEAAKHIGFGMRGLFEGMAGMEEPARVDRAMERYWAHFEAEGLQRHQVYPGVHLMLSRLKRQGHRIYVVSAKPTSFARQVAFQLDLHLYFDEVFGGSVRRPWTPKTEVMEELRHLGIIWPGGVMAGDRGDDMRAAKDHGLRAAGVAYGYGSREELREAGAEVVLESVEELDAWLCCNLDDPEIHDPFARSE
jgi:phosphoglycolate phosphatase